MRHNKLPYLFLLFSLTAAVPSCGFLDVVPPETEGPDDFLLEAEDALQYLYGSSGSQYLNFDHTARLSPLT